MDIRDFIQLLKKREELVEVNEECDWNYEISAFDLMTGRVGGPAFLFNKVKGVKEGRVLLGHFVGTYRQPHRRIALALGLDPEMDFLSYKKEVVGRLDRSLRPVEVSSGPCKEVIKMGKEINLLEFPFTYHALGEGARYCFQQQTVVKDPHSDWQNVGHYCMEIFSPRRVVLTALQRTDFRYLLHTKYEPAGQAMPVAMVIGGDPADYIAATTSLPRGVSEYDAIGGVRGSPLEVIRCETSNLLVPADAEIVIEGEIRPYETLPEGPRAESFGFIHGPRQEFPAVRINCVTHRKNPIILDLHQDLGGTALSLLRGGIGRPSGRVGGGLAKIANFPGFYWGGQYSITSLKQSYPDAYPTFKADLKEALRAAGGVFVDFDVPAYELELVLEAMATQVNPARDVRITPEKVSRGALGSAFLEEEDARKIVKGSGDFPHSGLIIDATTKGETPLGIPRTQFEYLFPPEVQRWVMDNWKKWGFEEEARWYKDYMEMEVL